MANVLKQISPIPAHRRFYCWILVIFAGLLLAGCGGGSSETNQPADIPEQQNPFNVKLQAFIENTPFDELGPIVNAGLDQFADANVVISLNGSAEAQGDAKLTNIEWGQIDGPEVVIPNPNSLSNIIAIPDSLTTDQVILYLQATDSNGRSNADYTVFSVFPLETFVRVISTSVDEDAGIATVRVELNRVSDQPTRVNFKTLDGSAKAGFDYVPEEGEITIPAGEIGVDITIALVADQLVEADETLLLYVAGENAGVQTTGIGSVIIRSSSGDSSLLYQSIAFADLGPLEGTVGQVIENAINDDLENAPGTGLISYASSNPLVATVNSETGVVSLVGPGTVVITAAKEEDETYAFAQASYTINASLVEQQLAFDDPGPIAAMINDIILNPLAETGEGIGAISYGTSDESIVSVDSSTGEATTLAEGSATISATKAADELFGEATASYIVNVELSSQSIAFGNSGPLTGFIGSTIINSLTETGNGEGAISFSSSNEQVATVGVTTGEVSLLALGNAEITATKAADSLYAEATASYTIAVELNSQSLQFESSGPLTSFVGDTLINVLVNAGEGSGEIVYSSNNEAVATVDSTSGQVSVLAEGSTTITATKAADEIFAAAQASYLVNVEQLVQLLEFTDPGPLNVQVGDVFTNALAETGDGSGIIVYSSSNPEVASVNATTGEISILAVGNATITASKAADTLFEAAEASYSIMVESLTQELKFAMPGPLTVEVGDLFTNALAETGAGSGNIVFSSSNPTVASVDASTGEVTALANGSTQITASKAADPVYLAAQASYSLEVGRKEQSIRFETSGQIGGFIDSTISNPLVETGEGTGSITFSSSSPSIASVDESSGLVTLLSEGTAVITATKTADSNYLEASASYTVDSELIPQILAFADPGPIGGELGQTVSNVVSTPEGTGAVTYVSSNSSVAAVDTNSGLVQLNGHGTALIGALIAADGKYDSAEASYTVIVGGAPQTIAFSDPGPVSVQVDSASFTNLATLVGDGGKGIITYSSSDSSIASVNVNTSEIFVHQTGSVTITALKASDSLYAATQASFTLVVTGLPQTIAFSDVGPVSLAADTTGYLNAAALVSVGGSGAISYSSSNTSIATVDSSTSEVTFTGTGTVTITAQKAADSVYASTNSSYDITVNAASQSIAFSDAGPVALSADTIGYINTAALVGAGGSGAISYSSSNTSIATVDSSTGEVTFTGTGSVTITAQKAADSVYAITTDTYDITVSAASQTIAFSDTGPVVTTGDASGYTNTAALVGSGGSGAISYSSSNTSIAAVDSASGEVTFLATGTVTITAQKAADSIYSSAITTYDLTISPGSQSIAFTDSGPVVLEADTSGYINAATLVGAGGSGAITYSSSDNGIVTVDSSTGEISILNIGVVTITADKAADALFSSTLDTYQLTTILAPETLSFQDAGPVTINVNVEDTYDNPLVEIGDGPGGISYSCAGCESEDAFVDPMTGQVEAYGSVTITVTATKQPGGLYAGGTASYQLTINIL